MVSLVSLVGLLIIVAAHTVLAAVLTRVLRVTMKTQWGTAIYTLLLVPVVLLLSTLVLSGVFQLGGDLGDRGTAIMLVIALPMVLGLSVDYFWMPHPDEVELPERA